MKSYRISWYAIVEDGSVLEGRSLVKGENQEQAVEEFFQKKLQEYRLKPNMMTIQSITELSYFRSGD
ncbi:hypothetical protein [Bacillus dakarensis]|uniref:hypothetical protein n=1 Tax=Robertmurraya dakarensis TaxID=1926278 RepID=UPI0009824DCC|nr:hypothetical protein [Bacillus dakarensis]